MRDRRCEAQITRDPTTLSFVGQTKLLHPQHAEIWERGSKETLMKRGNHKAAFRGHGRLSRDRGILVRYTIASVVWLLFAGSVALGQQKPSEFQVEAAYLYNFGRFVEWPASVTTAKTGSFTICVLCQDPFGPSLDATLAGEMMGKQSVVARRISSPQESVDCQILFISSSETNRLNKIIEALDKSAVLTVSDIPQFSQRRGMIQFVLEGSRIRFEVNLAATQRAGLVLSSELLKVATAVRRDRD